MASAMRGPMLRSLRMSTVGSRVLPSQPRNVSILTSCIYSRPCKPLATKKTPFESRTHSRPHIAAFHSSSHLSILPPPQQVIKGTVNDPALVPDPAPAHGSFHWSFERIIAGALIPLTVAPFATGSLHPITDATLCALLVIHSHIGFESIIIDYVPQNRLPRARKLFMWALKGGTLLVAVGLYEFETNDVGLTEAIKRIWRA